MRGSAAPLGLALVLPLVLPASAWAGPGRGTVEDPRRVDGYPWTAELIAEPEQTELDAHACPGGVVPGPGAETVLALPGGHQGRLIAWTEAGDAPLILIDDDGCVAADTGWLEADLAGAAPRRLIVEHPPARSSTVVHLRVLGPAWTEQPLAAGVTWRAYRGEHQGAPQLIQQLVIDLDQPGVELRLVEPGPNACATVAELAGRADPAPVAALNSSFFDPWPCVASSTSSSLMRQDGELLAINSDRGTPKAALGFTPEGELLTTIVEAGGDWPQTSWALGARGLLLADGRAVPAERWRTDENVFGHFVDDRHPRTALAVDVDGGFAVLTTVDGRRTSAAGVTLAELRELVATPIVLADGTRVEPSDAINLDGGGSTTLWIAGATPTGVVNYPSDGNVDAREDPRHAGSREVVGALLVYAPLWSDPPPERPGLAEPAAAAPPPDEAGAPSTARCRVNDAGQPGLAVLVLVLLAGLRCIRCNR